MVAFSMGHKELVVETSDLYRINAKCPDCRTEITFDVINTDTGLPKFCPTCNQNIQAVGDVFGRYRQFYQAMKREGNTIFTIRVSVKD